MSDSIGKVQLDLETNYGPFQQQLNGIAGKSTNMVMSAFGKMGKVIGGTFAVKQLIDFGKESINLASDLSEVQNVVDVVFGESSNQINNFAKNALNAYGLSELSAKQYTSTMGAMLKSMGLGQDQVLGMSQSITALTGDMASFYNLDSDTAFQKLRAGISGETEPLKQLGINMSVANMEAYALSQGITTSYQKMTQSEQALLRYNYLLSTTADAQGDFARTSDSWANQTRILSEQFNSLKATLGSAFITLLTPLVRWLNILVSKLQIAAAYFKAFVEYLTGTKSETESAAQNMGGMADELTDVGQAAESAASKANKALAGFDKLNVLSFGDSGGSGGGSGGSSSGVDFGSMGEFSSEAVDIEIPEEKLESFKNKLLDVLNIVGLVGVGIAAWKVTKGLIDSITIISTLLKNPAYAITIGAVLTLTGFALEFTGLKSAVEEGLSKFNFAEIVGGGLLGTGGAALLGSKIASWITTAFAGSKIATAITSAATSLGLGSAGALGAALFGSIGAIVAGIPAMIVGIYDACKNGIDWLSGLLIPLGSTAAAAGIGAIIGMLGGPIGAGIGALIGLAIGLITDLVILVVQNWDTIVQFCKDSLAKIGEFFAGVWDGVVSVWGIASEWFYTSVIEPLISFFSPLWESISSAASTCWQSIVEFFTPAITWFSELFNSIRQTLSDVFYNIGVIAAGCWRIIETAWGIVSEWFNKNIIEPLSEFFSELWNSISSWAINAWETIKETFSAIGGWIYDTVISPVGEFFKGLWDGFVSAAATAWEAVKSIFSKVATFFGDIFKSAWEKVVKVFSVAGEIFTNIKDAILSVFKNIVNGLIKGINSVVAIPFNGINTALSNLKKTEILGIKPFAALKTINVPQIPYLAKGGIIDQPTLAMVGERGKEAVVPLENTAFADAIANAILRVLAPLFSNGSSVGKNSDGTTVIVLKVGEYELGRITVGAINKYHNVIGKVELEV